MIYRPAQELRRTLKSFGLTAKDWNVLGSSDNTDTRASAMFSTPAAMEKVNNLRNELEAAGLTYARYTSFVTISLPRTEVKSVL